jgi:putative FmdB family regulatory protein
MPIYEYQCDECGHVFEEMKKRTAPPPSECPECGAPDPRRAISRTGFKLKGSGWYVTDYKSDGAASNGTSSSGESDSGSASDTESTDDSDGSDPDPGTRNVA